jgi:hypothetical protein
MLHRLARVTSESYTDDAGEIEAEVPESVRKKLARYVVTDR